ncbi:hypothetical protein [Methylopila sp. 73B]|uniref:hypothetical protein n=1 Tax=Methylopila sp. 73B TaxID=1120792 RepID=UPI0012DEBCF4|nr:hypothetical protein [Methylopila sp. 73B]
MNPSIATAIETCRSVFTEPVCIVRFFSRDRGPADISTKSQDVASPASSFTRRRDALTVVSFCERLLTLVYLAGSRQAPLERVRRFPILVRDSADA